MGILGSLAKVASKVANVGVGLAQALTGNFKSAPGKGSNKNVEPIDVDAISSATDVLGLIYNSMVRARDEELESRKELEESQKKQKELDDTRNEELIKALTVRRKTKKKTTKKPSEKKEVDKKVEQKKKSDEKKVDTEKKKSDQQQKKTDQEVKKQTAEKKVEETKAEVKKPAEKVPAKEAPKTPEKAPTPQVPKPSAAKIVTGATIGAAGVFATSEAFASNMMPYAEKASKALGGKIPPVAILGQWAGESSNGKSVSAPFNYAGIKAGKNDKKGDYVLTEEFYTNAQLERAKASGESFERVVELGDKIKKKGKDVDAWDFYGGPGKGSVLYQQKKAEGKQMVQVRSYFAKFDNPEEFTDRYVQFLSAPRYAKARESTTPAQFGLEVAKAGYATASSDKYSAGISDYAKNYSSLIKATPTSTPFTGSQLDQASKENKDMKSAAEVKNQTNVNNTNITTSQNASKQVVQQEEVDDRRPIDRKT